MKRLLAIVLCMLLTFGAIGSLAAEQLLDLSDYTLEDVVSALLERYSVDELVIIRSLLDSEIMERQKVAEPPVSSPQAGAPTMGERNAISSAKQYLSVMAFSRTGLIEQLQYEGYSLSEATYGADHCEADWNQQAVLSAKQYLSVMAFSRSGLIEQLEYEGYTHEQAVYGVTMNGY